MTTVTRFAPSPTGFLHIGGARTALFNWLYAKHTGGTFLLRIEDTDHERSTEEASKAIVDGLRWLGLEWDGQEVYQSKQIARHAAVANELLARGQAYRCYCTAEELDAMRKEAETNGQVFRYDRRWRDRSDAPEGLPFVVRIKAPLEGELTIHDQVQGEVKVAATQLDDFVLLRSDGTPTYMLAVVVDDYDMGVTHVIRGDDHLNNAFRQRVIIEAMGWPVPTYAHIPLIHGQDGAKLSKRHGALGVEAYRDMGYLPEALRNYLLRLGWAHGDAEIISTKEAIEWFDLGGIGRSPSRFDFTKLEHVNAHYLRESDDGDLARLVSPRLGGVDTSRLAAAMPMLKPRAKTLVQLAEAARFLFERLSTSEDAQKIIDEQKPTLIAFSNSLENIGAWDKSSLEALAKQTGESLGLKLGQLMAPIRAAIAGSTASPSMFEVMEWLGKDETIERLRAAC